MKPGDKAAPAMTVTLANGKSGEFVPAVNGSFRESDFGQVEIPIGSLSKVVFGKVGTHPVERGRSMEHLSVAHSGHPNQSVTGWGPIGLACLPCAGGIGSHAEDVRHGGEGTVQWDVALVEPPREVVRQEDPPAPAPCSLKSNRLRRRRKLRPQPVRAVEPPPQPVQRQVKPECSRKRFSVTRSPWSKRCVRRNRYSRNRKSFRCRPSPLNRRRFTRRSRSCRRRRLKCSEKSRRWLEQQIMDAAPATAQTYQAQSVVGAPAVVETVPEPVMTASAPVVHTAPAVEAVEAPPTRRIPRL